MSRDLKIEIAERKRAEKRAKHLNAFLRAVRNVSQLIAREKDRGHLLQGACECLSEVRGYHSSWIVFLDESGRVTAAAEAGLGEVAVGIAFSHDIMAKGIKKGYPVVMTFPKEGTGYEIGAVSLLKGGPEPELAKVFFDWLMMFKLIS